MLFPCYFVKKSRPENLTFNLQKFTQDLQNLTYDFSKLARSLQKLLEDAEKEALLKFNEHGILCYNIAYGRTNTGN